MDCYPLTCGQIVQHPIVSRTMHALHTIVEVVGEKTPFFSFEADSADTAFYMRKVHFVVTFRVKTSSLKYVNSGLENGKM